MAAEAIAEILSVAEEREAVSTGWLGGVIVTNDKPDFRVKGLEKLDEGQGFCFFQATVISE